MVCQMCVPRDGSRNVFVCTRLYLILEHLASNLCESRINSSPFREREEKFLLLCAWIKFNIKALMMSVDGSSFLPSVTFISLDAFINAQNIRGPELCPSGQARAFKSTAVMSPGCVLCVYIVFIIRNVPAYVFFLASYLSLSSVICDN